MDVEITAAWITSGAGVLVGLFGSCFAGYANSRAKKSADAAETANKIAADALSQARVANKHAEDANRLSEQANTVLEVQAAREVEEWNVHLNVDRDRETPGVIVRNKGADPALDATVVVHGKGLDGVHGRFEQIPDNDNVTLPLPQLVQKAQENLVRGTQRTRRWELIVHVTWRTELGRRESKSFEMNFSYP